MLKLPTTPDRLIDKQYVALMQNGDISLVTGFNAPQKTLFKDWYFMMAGKQLIFNRRKL